MHPARSVILFTTTSGAGYGILIMLALYFTLPHGGLPPSRGLLLVLLFLSFVLIVSGLSLSTYHLGRPERAWRALSQWRSSWLSREGVFALLTFPPLVALTLLTAHGPVAPTLFLALLWATAVLALATVISTAMIYGVLKPIRAWANPFTVPMYLLWALASGAILLHIVMTFGATGAEVSAWATLGLTLAAALLKFGYWAWLDRGGAASTAGTATGLGGEAKVNLLEAPHTEENYLLREMGFRIARKHSKRLRALFFGFAGAVLLLLGVAVLWTGTDGPVTAILAGVALAMAVLIERWLFFAEAKHTVTLYYGVDRV